MDYEKFAEHFSLFDISAVLSQPSTGTVMKTVETRAYNMHYNEILKRHIWRQIFVIIVLIDHVSYCCDFIQILNYLFIYYLGILLKMM